MDLEEIANHAYERNDYPLAADLGRRIFRLIPIYPLKTEEEKGLPKRMEKLASKIAGYNNAYLQKHQCFVEKHHRMLTYMIDKKLRPKKKQPDFVTSQLVYELRGNFGRIGVEWMFAQTCQRGAWLSRQIRGALIGCRYLHHGNPYLKLGPFLEEQTSVIPYLVVFHDLLSENEIQYLVEEARPNLSRNRTFELQGVASQTR